MGLVHKAEDIRLRRRASYLMPVLQKGGRMKLTGTKALITGGNSGIGLATARLFIAEGAQAAITGRDQQTLLEERQPLTSLNIPSPRASRIATIHSNHCPL